MEGLTKTESNLENKEQFKFNFYCNVEGPHKDGTYQLSFEVFANSYEEFVAVVNREHRRVFGSESQVLGDEYDFMLPAQHVPSDQLSDWKLRC